MDDDLVTCTSCAGSGCGHCSGTGMVAPGKRCSPPSPRWRLCPVCNGCGCEPGSRLARWCSGGRLPARLWDDPDFVAAYAIATGSVAEAPAAPDVGASARDGVDADPAAPDAPQGRHKAADAPEPAAAPIAPSDADLRTTAAVARPTTTITTAEGVLGGSGGEPAENPIELSGSGVELARNRPEPAKTGSELPPRVIVEAPRRRSRRAAVR